MPSESRAINEGTAQPERAAITARIVPVLAAGPDTQRAATPTRPLVATGDVTDTVTALGSAGDAAPSGPAVPASDEDEPDVLIEWGSNPQIPVHVRSDLNALLTPTDAATLSGQHDESDWLLVLDDERDGVPGASLETRRRRVLSADGEAEDPDESLW